MIAAFAALGGAFGLLTGPMSVIDKLQLPVSTLLIEKAKDGVELKAGNYVIGYWWLYLIAVLAVVVVAAVASAIQHELNARSGTSSVAILTADKARWKAEYARICTAIGSVLAQMYNPDNPQQLPPPRITFRDVDCLFEIDGGGNTTVTQRYVVEAEAGQPAQFWEARIEADAGANPLETPADIGFTVAAKTANTGVMAVPLLNEPLKCKVAVFFLPEIASSTSRQFDVSYHWKRWFAELFGPERRSAWTWSYQSKRADDTATVRFRFEFATECGAIQCAAPRGLGPQETLIRSSGPSGGVVWEYFHPAAAVGRTRWELEFSAQ